MAKINGNPVDPKNYAARVTNAKKIIAKTDPETKKKIAQMYSKATPTPKPKATAKPVVKVPVMNSKKIQDMLTGKTPVLLNGKKPKNAQELKEAIRQKTGVYPNTAR